jgi:hypothetical protein
VLRKEATRPLRQPVFLGWAGRTELAVLVRDVARTFDMRMRNSQVQEEVRKILAQLGRGLDGTLTDKEFVTYVQAHPQIFGPLMVWQTVHGSRGRYW